MRSGVIPRTSSVIATALSARRSLPPSTGVATFAGFPGGPSAPCIDGPGESVGIPFTPSYVPGDIGRARGWEGPTGRLLGPERSQERSQGLGPDGYASARFSRHATG